MIECLSQNRRPRARSLDRAAGVLRRTAFVLVATVALTSASVVAQAAAEAIDGHRVVARWKDGASLVRLLERADVSRELARWFSEPALADVVSRTSVLERKALRPLADDGFLVIDDGDAGQRDWVIGVRLDDDAWSTLARSTRPVVRGGGRLAFPELGLAGRRIGEVLLIGAMPVGRAFERTEREFVRGDDPFVAIADALGDLPDAPLHGAIAHDAPMGGRTAFAMVPSNGRLRIELRGRYDDSPLRPSPDARPIDTAIVARLPDDSVVTSIERQGAGLWPGAGLLEALAPRLARLDRAQARGADDDGAAPRRIVVIDEAESVLAGKDGGNTLFRVPAVVVAFETDDPDRDAFDRMMLASLRETALRFGAELDQPLPIPRLADLPRHDTRTVVVQPLVDSLFIGHPLVSRVSANWCVVEVEGRGWRVLGTDLALLGRVVEGIDGAQPDPEFVATTQMCTVDPGRLARLIESWAAVAEPMVGAGDPAVEFRSGVRGVARLLETVRTMRWTLDVPDDRRVEATIEIDLVETSADDPPQPRPRVPGGRDDDGGSAPDVADRSRSRRR